MGETLTFTKNNVMRHFIVILKKILLGYITVRGIDVTAKSIFGEFWLIYIFFVNKSFIAPSDQLF